MAELSKTSTVTVGHFKCGCGDMDNPTITWKGENPWKAPHMQNLHPPGEYPHSAGGLAFEIIRDLSPVPLREGDVLEVTVKVNRKEG